MIVADLLAIVVSLGIFFVMRPGPIDYQIALQFAVAVFLVDLLDLWMPYGEPVPVDTALVVACLVLGGVYTALLVSIGGRLAVYVARRGTYRPEQLLDVIARRLVSLAVCGAIVEITVVGTQPLAIQSLIIGLVLIALELVIAQLQAAPVLHERVSQLLAGNLELQGSLLAAQLSIAALVVITYEGMGVWGLSLMTLLVLLMRQSLSLVLEIRQAYRGTIEALVAAIEIQDPKRRGHARRTERIARTIGLEVGISGRELEHLGYAALLHDVDLIGVDPGSDLAAGDADTKSAAGVVAGVGFLEEVAPILRVCDGAQMETAVDERAARLAAMVALASDIDDASRDRRSIPGSACRRVSGWVSADEIDSALQAARDAGLIGSGATG